jgi:hypothetical protein
MSLWWALCGAAWREQPGRIALAMLAVALGVALALGVHLLNGAALLEFSRAARSLAGQPDLVLRAAHGVLADTELAALLARPEVTVAAPVIEGQAQWRPDPAGKPATLRLVGVDPLALLSDVGEAGPIAPDLIPAPEAGGGVAALLDPGVILLNPAARQSWSCACRSPAARPRARRCCTSAAAWPRRAGRWRCWTLPPRRRCSAAWASWTASTCACSRAPTSPAGAHRFGRNSSPRCPKTRPPSSPT